jgi:cytoskeleton protein RodZ
MQMKEFDGNQREKLKSIADRLRQERQEKAISLEEIAVKTFIPLRLLQALDTGHVERLPEPVFVQGFIRRYADALGLDGWALAKTFPTEPIPPEPRTVEPAVASASPPRIEERVETVKPSPIASPAPARLEVPNQTRFPFPLPKVAIAAAVVLLVGVGAIALFNSPKSDSIPPTAQDGAIATSPDPSPLPSPSLKPSSPQPSAAAPLPTTTSKPAEPEVQSTSSSTAPVQVTVDLRDGDSWMEVVADGKTEFQGILKQGEQKNWTAQKKLVLISGNAGAVYVSHNEGEEKKLGAIGEVKDITFSSEEAKPPQKATPSPVN